MSMHTAYTPVPWTVTECGDTHTVDSPDGLWLATMEHGDTKANAEFIVRACNSHEELVESLKFILAFYEADAGTYLDTEAWKRAEKQARAALAKAEGQ